jgi:hypothetical protein
MLTFAVAARSAAPQTLSERPLLQWSARHLISVRVLPCPFVVAHRCASRLGVNRTWTSGRHRIERPTWRCEYCCEPTGASRPVPVACRAADGRAQSRCVPGGRRGDREGREYATFRAPNQARLDAA